MARQNVKKLVRCADYNGYRNVLFMMDGDDFRLSDARFSSNYTVLASDVYAARDKTFTTADGDTYTVFADWSLQPQPAASASAA
jgi:hypothetical protein